MNRHQVDDLKQIGLCLATCLILIFIHCEATIGAVQNSKESMAMNPSITCQNERLTIKAKAVPLEDLLDRIAKICDLRIFSATADKTTLVDVDLLERTVEQSLKELLRGHSYLVIYNEVSEKTGLVSMVGATRDANNGLVADRTQTEMPLHDRQAESLQKQIDVLGQRIESGASDRYYDIALKMRNPRFVKHDRELIVKYQEQLSKLENKMDY